MTTLAATKFAPFLKGFHDEYNISSDAETLDEFAKPYRDMIQELIEVYGSDDGYGPIDIIERAKALLL